MKGFLYRKDLSHSKYYFTEWYMSFNAKAVSLTAHLPSPKGPSFTVIYEGEVKFRISLAINIHLPMRLLYWTDIVYVEENF